MVTRWPLDGTQPPKPLPTFPDPLAGLITGSTTPSGGVASDAYDEIVVPIAKPVQVDREAAQAMLHAVMDDPEDAPPKGPRVNPAPRKTALPTGAVMPGMVAPAEKLPAKQRVKQALGTYPKDAAKRRQKLAERREDLMRNRPGPPPPTMPAPPTGKTAAANGERHPNRNLGGFVVALILLVVFGAIAISVIASIIEAIGGAFE